MIQVLIYNGSAFHSNRTMREPSRQRFLQPDAPRVPESVPGSPSPAGAILQRKPSQSPTGGHVAEGGEPLPVKRRELAVQPQTKFSARVRFRQQLGLRMLRAWAQRERRYLGPAAEAGLA